MAVKFRLESSGTTIDNSIVTYSIASTSSVPEGLITDAKLSIIRPNGNSFNIDAELDDDRKLIVNFNVAEYGIYSATLSCLYDNKIFKESSLLPVTYTNIYQSLLSLSQIDSTQLTIEKYNQFASTIIIYWLDVLKDCLSSYDELGIMNGNIFDMAILIAMNNYMRPFLSSSSTLVGEIAAISTGPDKVEYFRKYGLKTTDNEEEMSRANIWQLLNLIPSVAQCTKDFASNFESFKTAGRRKAFNKIAGVPSFFNPYNNLYGDPLTEYLFNGGFLNEFYIQES